MKTEKEESMSKRKELEGLSAPVKRRCEDILKLYIDRNQIFIGWHFSPKDLDEMYRKGYEDGKESEVGTRAQEDVLEE